MSTARAARWAAVVVCLAAVLPYARTIDNYFVQDDFGVVWLLSQKPWTYFPHWFVSTWMDDIWGYTPDEIRPFPALTYQIAAAFGAGSPVANHVINIALHAANGVLVLWLAHVVAGLSVAASTIAAIVFVVLPFQAESVTWATGRVDSMPAFFYLASFILYARWRARDVERRGYWWSVALFFVALFSKQNAITLGPALVAYDLVIVRHRVRLSWDWMRPYAPFALLTIAYLVLRLALFGEVARESQLTAANLSYFAGLVVRHLRRTVFGDASVGTAGQWILVGTVAVGVAAAAMRAGRGRAREAARTALYFGVFWWAVGVAPVLVAAYESPRHIYLASVGWAVLLGLAWDLTPTHRPVWRAFATVAATALIGAYSVQLVRVVDTWETRSVVSARAVAHLEREALAVPEGALIIAGAPVSSWEWAAPFVLRPPFVRPEVERRITLVTPWLLHCCRSQWDDDMRTRLRAWRDGGTRGGVVALRWDGPTGVAYRLSSAEEPYLRPLLDQLLETDSSPSLDRGIRNLLDRLPPDRRPR
jgi:hypothetical protein